MLKTFSVALILSGSLSALAQSESLEKLTQDVQQLVEQNSRQLNSNDQMQIRHNLRQVIQLFKLNGYEVGGSRNYTCESNNNHLIDLDNGGIVHDFTSIEACREALANVKAGKTFCDFDNNTLYQTNGQIIFDFTSPENCRDAIASIARVKKFCDYDNNTLRKADGSLIYDFNSREQCLSNLGKK